MACNVIGVGCISCCKSCCITLIKEKIMSSTKDVDRRQKSMDKMMENIGRVIQFGSFIGTVSFFSLVKWSGIFHQ